MGTQLLAAGPDALNADVSVDVTCAMGDVGRIAALDAAITASAAGVG